MGAFEKWWGEELSDEAVKEIRSHAHLTIKEKVDRLAEISWKASKKHYLEWMLEESKRFDYTGLTEVIKDELDEGD